MDNASPALQVSVGAADDYNEEDQNAMLEAERKFFESVQASLLQVCPGNFVVIKNQELIGSYQTMSEALSEGARRFGLDSFLVRRVDMTTETVSIPALSLGLLSADPSPPIHGER